MSLIDPRAIIDPSAKLADDVQVGPWSIIGPDVEIAEGTVIGPHVIIKGPTKIGRYNRIYQFSSVGENTPDLKYKGEDTRLVIGDHNVIREGVLLPTIAFWLITPRWRGMCWLMTGQFFPVLPWSISFAELARTASRAWVRR
jgi:hypothetical protein